MEYFIMKGVEILRNLVLQIINYESAGSGLGEIIGFMLNYSKISFI
jgi:hypothetical protein